MYNLPNGVTAALVIKNATSCTSNPCDFEKIPDAQTVACVLSLPPLVIIPLCTPLMLRAATPNLSPIAMILSQNSGLVVKKVHSRDLALIPHPCSGCL